ncbi:MAG: Kdo hydroxylase family protein [Coxiellaceae bacterium]|nr:Kdo hydroxylase family protein [Coxiellaceae bacterium]
MSNGIHSYSLQTLKMYFHAKALGKALGVDSHLTALYNASMNNQVKSVPLEQWQPEAEFAQQQQLASSLEANQLLLLPQLSFNLLADERALLTDSLLSGKRKNISFDKYSQKLGGCNEQADKALLTQMMRRFIQQAEHLVHLLLPEYQDHLIPGRTSYRPAKVEGRQADSYRKDDSRLHVDAFPSTPMQDLRILRFFANINPNNQPRTWRIGEPFEQLAERFIPDIHAPTPGTGKLMKWLHLTRKYRTRYDHYMLKLHNKMKADDNYQQQVTQTTVQLPANSCWMVFTDSVSHAAMAGQFCLEQTFYLPISAMNNNKLSPQHILQQQLNRELIPQL